jgi:serine protease Do
LQIKVIHKRIGFAAGIRKSRVRAILRRTKLVFIIIERRKPLWCRYKDMRVAPITDIAHFLNRFISQRVAAVFLLLCPVFGLAAEDSRAPESGDIRRDATVRAVEQVMPSVVNIRTESYVEVADRYDTGFFTFYGQPHREAQQALGSGIIIDEDGYLLTNLHVVKRASRVQVKLSQEAGGEVYDVQPVFFAREEKDIALLKIIPKKKGEKFKAVKMARNDDEFLGETVIAMGNPFGLEGSVSQGILSSKQRGVAKEGEPLGIANWLQTDAAINPGNSGGPLINVRGELIGLNVAIVQREQGSPIGFAIPIKEVRTALTELFKPETVASNPRWFGAQVSGAGSRLVITDIDSGSPAEKAGLKRGDIILVLDGKKPQNFMEFTKWIRDSAKPEFTVAVDRGGQQITEKVRLIAFNDLLRQKLGADLQEITPDLAQSFSSPTLRITPETGLAVARVEKGGPAEKAGLRMGQIIVQIDGQNVNSLFRLFELIALRKSDEEAHMLVLVPQISGNDILGYRQAVAVLKLR